MGSSRGKLRAFFSPPSDAKLWIRLLPYLTLGVLTILVLVGGAYMWDYTNSPSFCGTTCHTMPPEYTAYLVSPHARVDCVDCHIGRGFIATRISRKFGDLKHIFSLAFKNYEFPIEAEDLRPARETCERCHFPEKFSDDSLREIIHFGNDPENILTTTYLTVKTGGGSKRLGLGRGIHWHVENQVFFLPLDADQQVIPFVRVIEDDGSTTDYLELGSEIDASTIDLSDLQEMDCITCHNRISHLIYTPEQTIDQLLARGAISPSIPEIRSKALEVYNNSYSSNELALDSIAGLAEYYQAAHPEFFAENGVLIDDAIAALQDAYQQSVFPEQLVDWTSHPNNIGHDYSPGCFRCHDGKHLNQTGEAIRLECNVCHSIPVVAGPGDFVARIEISRGPEPETHLNANWITLHRDIFDSTCANCHTIEDPGGTSNQSFCSNSACHGVAWEYAGFDAPGLAEILRAQQPTAPPSMVQGPLTFTDTIGPLLLQQCGSCHAENAMRGLNLATYQGVLQGGESGPAIIPGDPENSLLLIKLTGEHFGQLTSDQLDLLAEWILAGAPEE